SQLLSYYFTFIYEFSDGNSLESGWKGHEMDLILTEDVMHLGKHGQVVSVASGYGRNYLIPKGLAIPATALNLKMIEQQRVSRAKKEAKLKEEAAILTQELNQLHLLLSRKTGETGSLFGSVTSKDLADLLAAKGILLDRRKILLQQPIKQIGNFEVEVRPHSEVRAELLVSVAPEEDEEVARVLRKGEESAQILSEVEARLKEFEQATAEQAPLPPPDDRSPTEEPPTP
ncbi:MAG: 50S ribosomal protein L9, partial [Acidobacteriota bacterium]